MTRPKYRSLISSSTRLSGHKPCLTSWPYANGSETRIGFPATSRGPRLSDKTLEADEVLTYLYAPPQFASSGDGSSWARFCTTVPTKTDALNKTVIGIALAACFDNNQE